MTPATVGGVNLSQTFNNNSIEIRSGTGDVNNLNLNKQTSV